MKKLALVLISIVVTTSTLYALPRWIKGPWPCVNMSYNLRETGWPDDTTGIWAKEEQLRSFLEQGGVDLSPEVHMRGQNNVRMLYLYALGREQQKLLKAFPGTALNSIGVEDNRLNYTLNLGGRIFGIRESARGAWEGQPFPEAVRKLMSPKHVTWGTVIHFGTPVEPRFVPTVQGQLKPEDFEHSGRSFIGIKYKVRGPALGYEGRAWPVLFLTILLFHLLILGLYRPLLRAFRLRR